MKAVIMTRKVTKISADSSVKIEMTWLYNIFCDYQFRKRAQGRTAGVVGRAQLSTSIIFRTVSCSPLFSKSKSTVLLTSTLPVVEDCGSKQH